MRQASKESSPASSVACQDGADGDGEGRDDDRHNFEALLDRDPATRALVYDEKHITFFTAVFKTNKLADPNGNAAAAFLSR